MNFIVNAPTSAKQIADLREAVGWNRMESCYKFDDIAAILILALKDHKRLRTIGVDFSQ